MVAERTKIDEIRGFLLRLSGALASGEDEDRLPAPVGTASKSSLAEA